MKKNNRDDISKLIKKILVLLYILLLILTVFVSIKILTHLSVLKFILNILNILIPFGIGYVIAILLEPILKKMSYFKIPKVIGALIIYALIFFSIYLVISYILPCIYHEAPNIIKMFQEFLDNLNVFLLKFIKNDEIVSKIMKILKKCLNKYLDNSGTILIDSFTKIIKYFLNFLVGLVIGLYMIIHYEKINLLKIPFINKRYLEKANLLLEEIKKEVRTSVIGTLKVSFFVFVTSLIFFSILKIPNPLIYAFIAFVTDLIPYLGPYIGGIPVLITGFTISKKLGIITLITIIIIQSLENYIYSPIILSKETKLNPLLIMMGLLIFGKLFGIIGLIIATPIVVIIKTIYKFIKNNVLISDKRI